MAVQQMQVAQWEFLLDSNGSFRKELTAECTSELNEEGNISSCEATQGHTPGSEQDGGEHQRDPKTIREVVEGLKNGCARAFPW